jgi:hypothetical protein
VVSVDQKRQSRLTALNATEASFLQIRPTNWSSPGSARESFEKAAAVSRLLCTGAEQSVRQTEVSFPYYPITL